MNVAIYSRRSKLTDSGDSILYQKSMCAEHARRLFGECGLLYYEDEGFSGGNTSRPAFRRLLDDIAHGRVQALVCYRLDRLSRSIGDFTATLELLERWDVAFSSVTERFDTSAPMGRAMLYIASVFAQLERDTTAQRIRDSFTELAKTGRRLTAAPPEGFTRKRLTDAEGRVYSVLEVHAGEAAKIKMIYELYIERRSLAKTATACAARGITARSGKAAAADWLRRLLRHPAYAQTTTQVRDYLAARGGIIASGGDFDGSSGTAVYRVRGDAPIVAPGAHDYIIDGESWLAAQRIMDGNRNDRGRARGVAGSLRGLLFCGLCGATMRPAGLRKNGWFSYVCTTKDHLGKAACNLKNLGMDTDWRVAEAIRGELGGEPIGGASVVRARNVLASVAERIVWDGEEIRVYYKAL